MVTMSCLSEDRVLDFIDGRLERATVEAVQQHIDGCDACRRLMAAMARASDSSAARSSTLAAPDSPLSIGPTTAESVDHAASRRRRASGPFPTRSVTDLIDYYRLLRPLGHGGGGMVYRGHDTLLDRPVAIKFLVTEQPEEHERLRLLNEARALARLRHPHVVAIHHVGETDGEPYIVMELLEGQTLRQLALPLAGPRVLEIGIGLCRGLAAAHRQGILHRDIKSSNAILTTEGEVKLIDFGLAKLGGAPSTAAGAADGVQGETARQPPTSPPDVPLALSTSEGAVLGTPPYMAPEIWQRAPATSRSDVYSLGVVLYELATGYTPVEDPAFRAAGGETRGQLRPPLVVPPLRQRLPGFFPALADVIDRCLRAEPAARFASADEVLVELKALVPPPAMGAARVIENPYLGLCVFEAEHHHVFFGRESETRKLLERLRSDPLVVVTGDSGLGKSSLCRAGVLPRVVAGEFADRRSWSVAKFVPDRHPLRALAMALAKLEPGPATEPGPPIVPDRSDGSDWGGAEEIEGRLRQDPEAVARALCLRQKRDRGLVVFVDQMEELFTVGEAAEAEPVARFLGHLVAHASGGLRLLVTVRSDFLTRLATLPEIGTELSHTFHVLRPLGAEGVREAVVGPARQCGFRFESGETVEELVAAATRSAGGLPLLGFALAQLWEKRDKERRCIPAGALMAIGGVAGALSRHGDEVLGQLKLPEAKATARRVLLQLVSAEGTRIRRTHREIVGELGMDEERVTGALTALVKGRLLIASDTDRPEDGGAYELAHEALIEGWGELRNLLDEDRGQRAVRQRIVAAAEEWDRKRIPENLWVGNKLKEARGVASQGLGALAQEFVAASHARHVRRRIGMGVGSLLLVASVAAGFILNHRREREAHRREREALVSEHLRQAQAGLATARARQRELEEVRKDALARFDRPGTTAERMAAEQRWAEARERAAQVESALIGAEQANEAAIELDPGRPVLRDLRSELLFERIVLAEAWWQKDKVTELRGRLILSDRDGTWRARLDAPATLVVEVEPPGAHVVLERYEDDHGSRRPSPVKEWSGRAVRTLAPGSYRLRVEAPGRAAVWLPLLVGRGETRQVRLDLPAAASVPPGFVYIPPGRFLFGSDDDDDLRKGFFEGAPPEHPVETAGYLIGRTEVTLGEYIEFLRALPRAERAMHMPNSGNSNAAVKLEELPAEERDRRWRFTLVVQKQVQHARWGEPFRYPGRSVRAEQDWRRFPAAGLSLEDAEAYFAWLDRSGRVPGARLCTEQEWERAARGADDRKFPHGDELRPDDADFDETYGRKSYGPDEVGAHTASASPFGVEDLTGNVWEWVASAQDPRDAVHRGGTWWNDRLTGRSINRQISQRQVKHPLIGMRVCASLPRTITGGTSR
jgi:serine/threonine protein kinase/formylglycine-generating enzyme required for sulfatase activity